jgi:hypothetical protein
VSTGLTPAATLRAAAGRLRESAGKATSDAGRLVPWHVEKCAEYECPCIVAEGATSHHNEPSVPERYIADAETPELAEWIALAHPGVGVALAVVFEEWADAAEVDPDLINRAGGLETVAVARAVLAV